MVLILTEDTKDDTDWVPFEIRYAVDECGIPILAAYPGYACIVNPRAPGTARLWPKALAARIESGDGHVLHVPFQEKPLTVAIGQFTHNNLPSNGVNYYLPSEYQKWGVCSRCMEPSCLEPR